MGGADGSGLTSQIQSRVGAGFLCEGKATVVSPVSVLILNNLFPFGWKRRPKLASPRVMSEEDGSSRPLPSLTCCPRQDLSHSP